MGLRPGLMSFMVVICSYKVSPVCAQNKVLQLLDRYLFQRPLRVDTNYITRPDAKWVFKIKETLTANWISFEGKEESVVPYMGKLRAFENLKLGLSAAYRGLTLSYALDLNELRGEKTNHELNLTSYGNRTGGDIMWNRINHFEGYQDPQGHFHKMDMSQVQQDRLSVNGYYVFNYRRFSYPAAFTQSYFQKHSSGSLILGCNFEWGRIVMESNEPKTNDYARKIGMLHVGVGLGYAYNWVPNSKILISFSALPSFILYRDYTLHYAGHKVRMKQDWLDFHLTTRASFVWNFAPYFLGISVTHNLSQIGDDRFSIQDEYLTARVSLGRRF